MSTTTLPIELINNIFQSLERDSLYECMFVCKLWYIEAKHIYFQRVELKGNHQMFLNQLNSSIEIGGKIINHIKEIGFGDNPTKMLTKQEFNDLILTLPKLQKLHFRVNLTNAKYMQYLLEIPRDQLKNIQEIFLPAVLGSNYSMSDAIEKHYFGCKELVNYHLQINQRLHNTITCLSLYNFESGYFFNNKDQVNTTSILQYISQFKNLKYLKIDEDIVKIHMIQILSNCPNLVELDIWSEFCDTNVQKVDNSLTLGFNKSLKSLVLDVRDFTSMEMNYILQNTVPTNLTKLCLAITNKNFNQWLTDKIETPESYYTLKRFVQFIKQVRYAEFYWSERFKLINSYEGTDVIFSSPDSIHKSSKYTIWKLIQELNQDQPKRLTVELHIQFKRDGKITDTFFLSTSEILVYDPQHKQIHLYVDIPSHIRNWIDYFDFSSVDVIHVEQYMALTKSGLCARIDMIKSLLNEAQLQSLHHKY